MKKSHSFVERSALAASLGLAISIGSAAFAFAAELPNVETPAGFTVTGGAGGGRILSGRIATATSGYAAFREAARSVRKYFDAPPQLVGGVQSKDGAVTIVIFDASIRRVPIRGIVVARYQAGSATVSYLFDDPSHLAKSLPVMEAAVASRPQTAARAPVAGGSSLDERWRAAGPRSASVALVPASFADGSASVGVADGFSPQSMNGGEFVAVGPAGSFMRIDHQVAFLEPSVSGPIAGALPRLAYTPDVASVWTAGRALMLERMNAPSEHLRVDRALSPVSLGNGQHSDVLFGTADQNGKHLAYLAFVKTFPPTRGVWQMTFSVLWAQPSRIETDAPKMIAMLKSYHANLAVQQREVDDFNTAFNRREQAFTQSLLDSNAASRAANARASAATLRQSAEANTWISQSGQSAINNIAGNVTVFDEAGRHRTIPIEASDGYVPVPIAEYQKGVDYDR